MSWGATPNEVGAILPGDDLSTGPYFTRAISIDAAPSTVWPWLVQMGQDRGGFYSNDWLENVFTADIHSADRVHSEWQERAVGDRVPLARAGLTDLGGARGRIGYAEIVSLESERMLANLPGRFVLEPAGDRGTRLLFRESAASQGAVVARWLAWDPVHFVMVQRMLRGIKERAEARPLVPPRLALAARVGWMVATACLAAAFVSRRAWAPWLASPTVIVALVVSTTGDWDAAVAGFLAIGTTVMGVLALGRRWWSFHVVILTSVLLVLLLAPDPHAAFGLLFLAAGAPTIVAVVRSGALGGRSGRSVIRPPSSTARTLEALRRLRPSPREAPADPSRARQTAGVASLVLGVAVLAAVASLSGLLVQNLYRDQSPIREGWVANDAVTLFIALPLLVAALRRMVRGSARARLVAIGLLHYLLYDYGFYLFGATLNALLLLYAVIVAVSAWALVLVISRTKLTALAAACHACPAKRVAVWMLFVSLGLSILWTAQWFVALRRTTPPGRFDVTPDFIRVVAGLDLSLMVAVLVPGAVLLLRRRPWGLLLATSLNVSGALYNLVLAAGSIGQIRARLPGAWPMLAVWLGLSAGCLVCAVSLLGTIHAQDPTDGGEEGDGVVVRPRRATFPGDRPSG